VVLGAEATVRVGEIAGAAADCLEELDGRHGSEQYWRLREVREK
jgi:hypothetical protein